MSRQTIAGFDTITAESAVQPDRALDPPTVDGDVAVDLRRTHQQFDLTERRCEYVCASGNRFDGRWRGVPLSDLVTASEIAPDSTHLLVESDDGFRVCVAISDLLGGILATERLDGSDELPRLIAPSIDGTRTIKRVGRIEGLRLDPEDDPEDLERIEPTSEEETDD